MAPIMGKSMRGLSNFIGDIRNCQARDQEEQRVNKELAHIRQRFGVGKGIDGYQRKKYVCKLLYIYMLGYELDFGYMEAITLLSSDKFSEKRIGYLALSILINENHEMMPLMIQQLSNDMQARSENVQSLALTGVGNIGGKEMAESLSPLISRLLLAGTSSCTTQKKAALCLLRMFQKYPEIVTSDSLVEKLKVLLEKFHLGLLTSVMSLLLGMATQNPKPYAIFIDQVINILSKIVVSREAGIADYVYHHVANPWLQVKLLFFLRLHPAPTNPASREKLVKVLQTILGSADPSRTSNINQKNAILAVLFEAIELIVHLDFNEDLVQQSATILGAFIDPSSSTEINIRYLGLETMSSLATLSPEANRLISKHMDTVIASLKDTDISIRRRALDLLYGMADKENVKNVVSQLLDYLHIADYDIREELVIKIALLAEKLAPTHDWYVDIILQLISLAGEAVSDDIWHRVVITVTNNEPIQEYAAIMCFKACSHISCHETTVKVAGYILGEFGHLIVDKPGMGPVEQFRLLHSKYGQVGYSAKAILLSSYVKFANLYPELADSVRQIFQNHQKYLDVEIQQRACEYLQLMGHNADLVGAILEEMPAFPERKAHAEDEEEADQAEEEAAPVQAQPPERLIDTSMPSQPPPQAVYAAPAQPYQPPHQPQPQPQQMAPQQPIPSQPPQAQAGPLPNTAPDSDIFKRLCMAQEGVIYEDSVIQLGMKSQYQKHQGKMMLYFGNMSQSALAGMATTISPPAGLAVQAAPIAATIGPKQQVQQLVNLACVSAFLDAPVLQITYSIAGQAKTITTKLPVLLCKFMEPLQLTSAEFFSNWRLCANPQQEHQAIFKGGKPIDLKADARVFQTGFNLSVLQEIDPNVNNLVSAAMFNTGGNKPVMCLVRLESNPTAGMYRMTVRSFEPAVTQNLSAHLSAQLSLPA